jgi:alpha,alpha-trehalase
VHLAKQSRQSPENLYINLRAGAESGWDFSSRWFADGQNFETIHTTDIVPVDLNCLLFTLEATLAKAMDIAGKERDAVAFKTKAEERKEAIIKYCWNESAGFFCDYDFVLQQQQAGITAAGLFPLFSGIATKEQAVSVAEKTTELLLKEGGIVTTTKHTGQQWDAPNGWAPLQWVAYLGLRNYGFTDLATEIGQRWLSLNEKVFKETGKLMEKYNVEDLDKPAGGGEYVGQDGFGWTNGIYMALRKALGPDRGKN